MVQTTALRVPEGEGLALRLPVLLPGGSLPQDIFTFLVMLQRARGAWSSSPLPPFILEVGLEAVRGVWGEPLATFQLVKEATSQIKTS